MRTSTSAQKWIGDLRFRTAATEQMVNQVVALQVIRHIIASSDSDPKRVTASDRPFCFRSESAHLTVACSEQLSAVRALCQGLEHDLESACLSAKSCCL